MAKTNTSPDKPARSRKGLFLVLFIILTVSLACNFSSIQPGAPTATLGQATPTAGQPTGNPSSDGSVDTFVADLPSWNDVSPEKPENDGIPTGKAPVTDEEKGTTGDLYTCTTTQYDMTKNPGEIAMYNPDASVLWPGALIRGGSHLKSGSLELLAVSREKRAPLGISIQGGGVLGIPGGVSTVVDQPVGSTIREGINQIVANTLGADVAVGAGFSSFTSVESFSSTQTLLKLGLDARYLGAEVSGRLNYKRSADQHTYTAYFVQRLFTVSIDLPEKPSSLFADSVTASDLQSLGISADNLPLYIDSVSYGRILMFSFTSSASKKKIAAALEFSYNAPVGGVDAFSEAELKETLSTARIEVFALGGPNTGVQNLIRDGNLKSYFETPLSINQVEPISFTLRNLGDNRLAKVANTTEYDVKECTPFVGSLPKPIHWWTADGTTDDAVGGVGLGGFGGAYGAGWNGQDANNKAFVLDGENQYLNTYPTEQTVPTNGAFTVSAWINPRAIPSVHTIISQVGGRLVAGDFALRVLSGGRLQFYRRPSSYIKSVDVVVTKGIIPVNKWTHVTAVYGSSGGGGNLLLYVNGELAAKDVTLSNYEPAKPRPDTDLTMTRIGSSELTGDGQKRFLYNGSIDEVMIFDRALSADEVKTIYQNFDQYKP